MCIKLVEEVILDIKFYIEDDVEISYLHGINGSPTCSISLDRGIFMEYLISELDKLGLNIQMREVLEENIS